MRKEQTIFVELESLCASPGYVHAIAYFCFRDNMIRYSGEMRAADMQHLFSKSRLIRTEISTLIGLMLKHDIDYNLPAPQVLEKYVETTEALLEEILAGNPDPDALATRFQHPEIGTLEYDVNVPKGTWVMKSADGNGLDRDYDAWPQFESDLPALSFAR